jgi:hypothetical protein
MLGQRQVGFHHRIRPSAASIFKGSAISPPTLIFAELLELDHNSPKVASLGVNLDQFVREAIAA